jgi:hypothetical protein
VLDIASSYLHVGTTTTVGHCRGSDGLVRIHPPRELAAAAVVPLLALYGTFVPFPDRVTGRRT